MIAQRIAKPLIAVFTCASGETRFAWHDTRLSPSGLL
jgi:hypothetical protein